MNRPAEVDLWCAVVLQAVLDIQAAAKRNGRTKYSREIIADGIDAWKWIHSRATSVASFAWVCSAIGLSRESVIACLRPLAGKMRYHMRRSRG